MSLDATRLKPARQPEAVAAGFEGKRYPCDGAAGRAAAPIKARARLVRPKKPQSLSGGRIGVRTSSWLQGACRDPRLIDAFRQTGRAAVIDREIQLKSRERGMSAAEMELLPSVKHICD